MGEHRKNGKRSILFFRILKIVGIVAVAGATLLLYLTFGVQLRLWAFICIFALYLFGIIAIVLPRKSYGDPSVRMLLMLLAVPVVLGLAILGAGRFGTRLNDLAPGEWAAVFGGLLTYFGAGALALVQIRSTRKTEESNRYYQKLSVVPYISYINATYLSCRQALPEVYTFEKARFQGRLIEFSKNDPVKYFLIDFTARNASDYPITSISARCSFCAGSISNYESDIPVYIAEHQTESVRVILPVGEMEQSFWEQNDTAFITLDIFATNALEFTTKGMIFVRFEDRKQVEMTYRVAPISETNPFTTEE